MSSGKIVKTDLDSRYHDVWDAHARVTEAARAHRDVLANMPIYARFVGGYGGFIGNCRTRQPSNATVSRLASLIAEVLDALAGVDVRAQDAVRGPLSALQTAVCALGK